MLRDFQLCRSLYKSKHIDHLPERVASSRGMLVTEFNNSMIKTVKWFYFMSMQDHVPSFQSLINKWSSIWFKDVSIDDIKNNPDEIKKNINHFNTEANILLSYFHKTHRDPGNVILLDDRYECSLTPNSMISGSVDVVIKDGSSIIIKHIGMSSGNAYSKGTALGYKLILDSIGFRSKGFTENKCSIELLGKKKSIDAVITDVDINQAKALADEIVHCKNYYPSPGCYFCKRCRFAGTCWTNSR